MGVRVVDKFWRTHIMSLGFNYNNCSRFSRVGQITLLLFCLINRLIPPLGRSLLSGKNVLGILECNSGRSNVLCELQKFRGPFVFLSLSLTVTSGQLSQG